MKIIYDCTSAQPQNGITVNGGGEYSIRLLEQLISHKNNYKFTILLSSKKGENELLNYICRSSDISVEYYEDNVTIGKIVNTGNYNMLIFPVCYPQLHNVIINEQLQVIGIMHDLSTFYHAYLGNQPGRFCKADGFDWLRKIIMMLTRRIQMEKSLKNHEKLFEINKNTKIFTVSYFSQSAFNYFLPDRHIENVFYSPLKNTTIFNLEDEIKALNKYSIIGQDYFLISNISRWAKNNVRIIKALDELLSNKNFVHKIEKYKFVLTGCSSKLTSYIKRFIKNINNFIISDYVSSMEMEILYKNAYLFIYPSLLEGFGYPPIEAMRYGTLSICATSTSIPEICGDAVVYFQPTDMDSFKMAILRALNQKYYKSFHQKMKEQFNKICDLQNNDLDRLVGAIFENTFNE